MRWLYAGVGVRSGEAEFRKPYESPTKLGEVRIPWVVRDGCLLNVCLDLLSVRPQQYLYILGWFSGEGQPYGLYRDVDRPNVTWVYGSSKSLRDVGLAEMFQLDGAFTPFQDGVKGALPLDALVGERPFVIRRASLQLSCHKRVVPGVVRHESAYSPRGNLGESWGQPERNLFVAEAASAAMLNLHHVLLSEPDRVYWRRLFLEPFLSPAYLRRMDEKSVVIRNGVDLTTLDSWMNEAGGLKFDRGRSVGSFSRPTVLKGTAETLALYQKMSVANQVDRVVVTWPQAAPLAKALPEDNPTVPMHFEFHPSCSRKPYIQHAASVTCALWNSLAESSPFSAIECAYVGCVPILPRKEWVTSLPEEWPLVYDSMEEAHKLVLTVLANPEPHIRRAREWAAKNFDVKVLGGRFLDHVEMLARKNNGVLRMTDEKFAEWRGKSRAVKDVVELFRGRDQVTWDEVSRVTIVRDVFGRPFGVTHHDLPALVERVTGFHDDLSDALPVFRKT